ncbi:MAG: hypothetical protein U0P30_08835 [Vicinamibacterales bacterium]
MRDRWRLSRREFAALAAGAIAALPVPSEAAPKFPLGVFATSPDDTVELRAWAGRKGWGGLALGEGLLADIPVMRRVPVVVCNLPHWWLQTLWFTSQRIFYDENAERRQLSYTTRRYSMTTLAANPRGPDTDDGVAKLLAAVGATDANPGYLVTTISNGAAVRDYLVELRPER